ncbi:MAG: DUF4037 domain-containing protein [Spirochaetales bacterium]|nr:DUF4037 domain-containing protein [Spirochaetales bacterium]MBP7263752.1 DUF4037 domain-containing protein [Spirochaetia bacterium]
MKHRVERLAERLTSVLASWPMVECVLSCEASETDVLDPYFALVLDVFCSGDIPDDQVRQEAFENPGAFESSRAKEKDRFFLEGLPIRIEYKQVGSVDEILEKRFNIMWVYRNSGTYLFYRLVDGKVLYKRSEWIDRVREGLSRTPPEFWERLKETHLFSMEHSLSDLGGAALKDDWYFFMTSLVGFMRACISTLFAINQAWEPSDRHMTEALNALAVLPEDFQGRWATLLRVDGSATPERKYQVAQLVAKSIFSM